MLDEIVSTMDMVILLPDEAILPEEARRRLWHCKGSVRLVSDPVEAVAELASCRQPRAVMIVDSDVWPEMKDMQQAIARYWPDARVEVINDGEPQWKDAEDASHHEGMNAMLARLIRPVAALSRRGCAALTAFAIALLVMTPVIWLIVLMRGR